MQRRLSIALLIILTSLLGCAEVRESWEAGSMAARKHPGGTATTQVRDAIATVRQRLGNR